MKNRTAADRVSQSRVGDIERLEKQTWHQWLAVNLIAGIAILFFGFSALSGSDVLEPSSLVLPGGLFLLVMVSSLYFSYRYRRMSGKRISLITRQNKTQVKIQQDYTRLMNLCVSSRTFASKDSPAKLHNRIVQITYDTFPCDRVSLMIPTQNQLEVTAAVGRGDMDLVLGAKQEVGEGVAGWVAQHKKPLILGPDVDTSKFWRFKEKTESILASLTVPILFRDEFLGIVSLSREAEDPFSQQDLQAMQVLAYNAAISLHDLAVGSAGKNGKAVAKPDQTNGNEPKDPGKPGTKSRPSRKRRRKKAA